MPIPGHLTSTSPLSYQSKRCPTLSSSSAMKLSTAIVSAAMTSAMIDQIPFVVVLVLWVRLQQRRFCLVRIIVAGAPAATAGVSPECGADGYGRHPAAADRCHEFPERFLPPRVVPDEGSAPSTRTTGGPTGAHGGTRGR